MRFHIFELKTKYHNLIVIIYSFFVTDTPQLRIKTMCGIDWAGTNDWLTFTFCNDQKCCSTNEIPLANGREDAANQTVDCTIPDIFGNAIMGSCKDFDFRSDSMVTSNVTISRQFATQWNAWRGEWIKVALDSISFLECPIDGWIGGDNSSEPTFQTSSCQSKYNIIYDLYISMQSMQSNFNLTD